MNRALARQRFRLGLAVLAMLCLCSLAASCTCAPAEGPSPSSPKVPEARPEPEEGVYLYPTLIQARPGEDVAVEIRVSPSGWAVSGCEVVIAYDPGVMQPLDIETGSFLGATPLIGLEKIDSQSGTIALAMARVGEATPPSPAGVLATVSFRIADSAAAGTYNLSLTWVGLADQDFQDIIGFPTQGTEVWIVS